MPRTCRHCRRINPDNAGYCYHDGVPLEGRAGGAIDVAARPFSTPFVLPSGRTCANFNQLALACQADPAAALRLLRDSHLEAFLAGQGRSDLAGAAHAAARCSDRARGLDDFLGQLPGNALTPARLRVEPAVLDLGTLRPGEDRHCELRLHNDGKRLLHGSAVCDCPWLSLGDGPAQRRKLFQFSDHATLRLHVLGRLLRAYSKPQETEIVLESSGGTFRVLVRVRVPVVPFAEGVLAGAESPRELAKRAREAPREAVALIESGAVAHWYEANGWTYPVQGPPARGMAAVQQLFEALGLVEPPRVELGEDAVQLRGAPGTKVEYVLAVVSQANRAALAYGTSDQPWLHVGPTVFRGRSAFLPLTIPAVPSHTGETLQARVSVIANGNQRFLVPVTITIEGRPAAAAPQPVAVPPPRDKAVAPPPAPAPRPPAAPPVAAAGPGWKTFLPSALLVLALLGVVLRDYLAPAGTGESAPLEADPVPRLDIRFHEGKRDDELEKLWLAGVGPSMRFGLVTLVKGKEVGRGAAVNRLTFDPWGRTNNACLRFDGKDERLFGGPGGVWEEREARRWKDEQGKEHEGARSVWVCDDRKIAVTQFVELVRGRQSRILDTCRVRYRIDNRDGKPHVVGLRFLLDTFIGGNDGVPFTIPGEKELCDTMKDLPAQGKDKKVPDFLQALEKPDLAHPGTIGHLRLGLEGLAETPARVTLGAWPNERLRVRDRRALGPATLWEVPVEPMKALGLNDSAVVMYWPERPLAAGTRQEVGFEYGLWSLAGAGGRLAATVDGAFRPEGRLTVVAYVNTAGAGGEAGTATLALPDGFALLEGDATQTVPTLPPDATSGNRPVTWKVRAGPTGAYRFTITTSSALTQEIPVEIKSEIFN